MIDDHSARPMHKACYDYRPTASRSDSKGSQHGYGSRRTRTNSRLCFRPARRRWCQHFDYMALPLLAAATLIAPASAQSCISLARSTQCPGFNASSISVNGNLTALYPFLRQVTDVTSFDTGIQSYISGDFVRQRYQNLIGCSAVNLSNATSYYARYTASVLCNGIVQNSIEACGLTGDATRPLCADSCAQYAQSEREITESSLCGTPGPNADSQIRADLTNCALPANSLSGLCISGSVNERSNCGFADSTTGLCGYCAASSPNATDSCCVFSDSETRCKGVRLAITSTSSDATNSSTPASPRPDAASNKPSDGGLSGAQIAGVVIGSVLGALLLLTLMVVGCLFYRRRRTDDATVSSFDGSDGRAEHNPFAMTLNGTGSSEKARDSGLLYGGRVTRMAALEGGTAPPAGGSPAMSYMRHDPNSPAQNSTPDSGRHYGVAAAPTRAGSARPRGPELGGVEGAMQMSPAGSDGSARLVAFRDYYSEDMLRAGDLVSTLWAYQPQAEDEFELQRGDMLKVSGIWDDGWATGVRIRKRAQDWRPRSLVQRDSGMSHDNSSDVSPDNSPDPDAEVKAFPLVCVCSPRQWHKTIEGDTTTTTEGAATS